MTSSVLMECSDLWFFNAREATNAMTPFGLSSRTLKHRPKTRHATRTYGGVLTIAPGYHVSSKDIYANIIELTRNNINHIPKIIRWRCIGRSLDFQGLETAYRCAMDIAGYERNANPFYASQVLQLLHEPVAFFL